MLGPSNLLDALGGIVQLPSVQVNSLLPTYRATVEDVVEEATRHPRSSEPPVMAGLVASRLGQPELTALLSHVDGGADVAADHLLRELRGYEPDRRSSASDLPTFIRVLLLSQIDSVWWGGTMPFASDADVLASRQLVDLGPLMSAKNLEFQYRAQPAGLTGRTRDWLQHKAQPRSRPRVAGLRFTRARPAVVAVVNQIARGFAAALPRAPRLWVTSMVRSVEHQYRLRALGYAALLPSSHCAGYACDLEMKWFRRFDSDNVLGRLLVERQEAGQLNFIDEGKSWHLCVSPHACDDLLAAYDNQLRAR
jgi:Family of unknown function (DUF5715)